MVVLVDVISLPKMHFALTGRGSGHTVEPAGDEMDEEFCTITYLGIAIFCAFPRLLEINRVSDGFGRRIVSGMRQRDISWIVNNGVVGNDIS